MTREVTVATLLSALTVGLAVTAEPNNQNLACEAGNYAVGEDASVTCFFPSDVGRTVHHIYVTHYPFDTANNRTHVLICFRLHTKELECKVADGYSFNNVVLDNLTLAIPEVRGRFAGRYSCQLDRPEDIPGSTCDLNVNGTALTCQAGNFIEGEMAAVNCFFHKNIENTMHHVYVVRHPYNTTEKSTTALVCFRLHDKQLKCETEEGYSFNGIVSHKLSLEIPEVRNRFAGRYSCLIVPPDGIPKDTCDLNVKGVLHGDKKPVPSKDSGVLHGEKEPVPSKDSGVLHGEKEPVPSKDSDMHATIIIGIVVGAIVVIVLAALAVFTFIFKRLLKGRATTKNNVEAEEEGKGVTVKLLERPSTPVSQGKANSDKDSVSQKKAKSDKDSTLGASLNTVQYMATRQSSGEEEEDESGEYSV